MLLVTPPREVTRVLFNLFFLIAVRSPEVRSPEVRAPAVRFSSDKVLLF